MLQQRRKKQRKPQKKGRYEKNSGQWQVRKIFLPQLKISIDKADME